ncbi:NADH:ubiquinone oxidoreductase [Desulfovibrio psychrotolerans]|uniref:cytochrome-c3 hydrogenase n=1 Tax=Desulfovibrio psychrotolerans TaxID=415242 RepID=A0A7J0BV49_9BACT|nr:NADH:ubiquinone oxidoreductase [Desulfovibrio psychrotolerans]GFM37538.1 cytochrome b [Desulfovibrio psychrotolerans]
MQNKPKIAFFDFAGCEGDQLQVANLEESLLDLLGHVEVVSFREVMTGHSEDYDIAFVEGSITRPEDEARLKEIRSHAKILVAFGACATIGGVNAMKNFMSETMYRRQVYGDNARCYSTYAARPLSAVVKVDAEIHGCPIDRNEFMRIVKDLLVGKRPFVPDYPVCAECKQAGNICRYDLGQLCLGMITRAGCGACCITEGAHCWGCRGLAPMANLDAARYVMEERAGYSRTEVQDLLRIFLSHTTAPL